MFPCRPAFEAVPSRFRFRRCGPGIAYVKRLEEDTANRVIAFRPHGAQVLAQQSLLRPAVYLDHWAIRRISSDAALRTRFVKAVHDSKGTLALSLGSLCEFAGLEYSAGSEAADGLIDLLAPALFFLNFEPFGVIANEERVAAGLTREFPAADDELMKGYIEQPSESSHPLIAKNTMTTILRNRVGLNQAMQELAAGIQSAVGMLKTRYELEEPVRKAVDVAPRSTGARWSTLSLMQSVLRPYLVDARAKMTLNDGIDLLHTIVPTSYCDLVLLDGKWSAAVEQARERFQQRGISSPLAVVFSERRGGLSSAISHIENWKT